MLKLSQSQWEQLQVRDTRQFVVAVCDQFMSNRPDMLDRPGPAAVLERMQAAHDYALTAGFTSTPHILRLMYLSADAPRIHDDVIVNRYLCKPGATPEQRLDDLHAVINHKLQGDH
jgi:hypothetical protein